MVACPDDSSLVVFALARTATVHDAPAAGVGMGSAANSARAHHAGPLALCRQQCR